MIEAQPRPPCDASNHGSRKAEYSGVSARNQTPSSRPPARTSAPSRPTRLRLVGIVNCGRSSTWPLRFARPIPSPTSPSAVPNSLRLVRGPPLSAASSSPRAAQFTPKSVTSSPRPAYLCAALPPRLSSTLHPTQARPAPNIFPVLFFCFRFPVVLSFPPS
jgi:hypothetical protein